MAGTILPIVYGKRQPGRDPRALWWHTAGYVAGGGSLGAALGALGSLFLPQSSLAESSVISLTVTGSIGLLYGARELALVRVPAPQSHWQVPATWRAQWPPAVASLLYGFVLGIGFLTRIP